MEVSFPTSSNKFINEHGLIKWSNEGTDNEKLIFSVNIPHEFKLFKSTNLSPSLKLPIALFAFLKNENNTMQVIVQCSIMQHEIALEDYYTFISKVFNETILYKRLIDLDFDKPDILTERKFSDGETWITRRTGYKVGVKDGAFVVTINAASNLKYYNANADLIYSITSSFAPVNVPEYNLAECLRLFSMRDPGDFATYIPFSWQQAHNSHNNKEEMKSVFIKKSKKKINGILKINCLKNKGESLKDVLNKYLGIYSSNGLDMLSIELNKTDNFKSFSSLFEGNKDFEFTEGDAKLQTNIKFYIGEKHSSWYYIEIFGPTEDSDFEAWAINKRALEIVAQNFKVKSSLKMF